MAGVSSLPGVSTLALLFVVAGCTSSDGSEFTVPYRVASVATARSDAGTSSGGASSGGAAGSGGVSSGCALERCPGAGPLPACCTNDGQCGVNVGFGTCVNLFPDTGGAGGLSGTGGGNSIADASDRDARSSSVQDAGREDAASDAASDAARSPDAGR